MTPTRIVVAGAALALVNACPQLAPVRSASGDIDVAALTPARTVLVHVENGSPSQVQVFTIIGDKTSPLATVASGGAQTVALDPSLFPGTIFSLEIVPDRGPSKRLGPFHLSKGETANLIIPPSLDSARVNVRPSAS